MQISLFSLYRQWQKVIPFGIIGIASLALVFIWWGLGRRVAPVAPKTKETSAIPVQMPSLEENILGIKNANFFGSRVVDSESLPPSLLNLQVKAIFLHEPAHLSSAIILLNDGKEKLYKVGDSLAGEAVITQITADSVVISRGGRLERLVIPQLPLQFRKNTPSPLNLDSDSETPVNAEGKND